MSPSADDCYAGFPTGFFDRADDRPDAVFYAPARLVTHIDDAAIAAVGELYAELGRGCRTSGRRRPSWWRSA